MNINKTGGPAFPAEVPTHKIAYNPKTERNEFVSDPHPGMTLRDYFAAQVICSVIAYSHGDVDTTDGSHFAAQAYRLADAMLAERAK